MPRKTLALIVGLVLVTLVLFIIALRTSNQSSQPSTQQTTNMPLPTSPAHSVLSMSPNPVTVAPGQQGSVSVNIDTADNPVTAIQLELAYDPNVISNLRVTAGSLFTNSVVLFSKNNPETGRMTYMLGITPNSTPVQGMGPVATITFTANRSAVGKESQLALLPSSLVTARGVAPSVLKSSSGTIIMVNSQAQTTK